MDDEEVKRTSSLLFLPGHNIVSSNERTSFRPSFLLFVVPFFVFCFGFRKKSTNFEGKLRDLNGLIL